MKNLRKYKVQRTCVYLVFCTSPLYLVICTLYFLRFFIYKRVVADDIG